MHLRAYREKSKDEQSRDFFNVPQPDSLPGPGDAPSVTKIRTPKASTGGSGNGKEKESDKGLQGMEINAVLSVEGKEEVYVSCQASVPRQVARMGSDGGLIDRPVDCRCYHLSCASSRSTANRVGALYRYTPSAESRGTCARPSREFRFGRGRLMLI